MTAVALDPRARRSACGVAPGQVANWPAGTLTGTWSSGYADDVELWEAPTTISAHRHGFTDEDVRHALRNLIAVAADPRDDDVTLFLGPDRGLNLIEVGVLSTEDGPLIIHAMAARTGRFQNPKE